MGHFVEQHFPNIVPAMAIDQFSAQGDFALVAVPAAQPAAHVAEAEKRVTDGGLQGGGQHPACGLPLGRQPAQHLPLVGGLQALGWLLQR